MSDLQERPPRRRRRWLFRLLLLLVLALGALVVLDATESLPPEVQTACEEAGLCGHGLLDRTPRSTRLDFPIGANPGSPQATRAQMVAERRGDGWQLSLQIEALPGAPRYSLVQLLATREQAPRGEPSQLTLHDENRQPVENGRWVVVVTVPNEIFRNRDWVLRYRADTIDALAVSEDIAPHIRRAGVIR